MKILAVASAGGHWVQMMRLTPAFDAHEVVFVSTNQRFLGDLDGARVFIVPEASRRNVLSIIRTFFCLANIVCRTKPDVVISTGAAPGLMAIIVGRIIGSKTVWVDSIANVEEISLSGRIATKFANKVYTQWPHLCSSDVAFDGNVLS